jgi:hypothetical protein
MDWVISGLILTAIAGAIKLFKDVYDKKPQIKWLFYLELLIICLALGFGIFGRKSQSVEDQQKQADLYSKIDNNKAHTDTSISSATQAIIDSEKAREERMEASLRGFTKDTLKDRKPNIIIFPLAKEANPIIHIRGDTVITTFLYFNYGNSFAKELHFHYVAAIRNRNTLTVITRRILTHLNESEIMYPIPSLFLRDSIALLRKINYHNDKLYQIATYCYRDSLGREYGPIIRMFKTTYNHHVPYTSIVSEDEYKQVETAFKHYSMWPTKFF